MTTTITAAELNVSDIFEYEGHRYTVTSWMKTGNVVHVGFNHPENYTIDFYADSPVNIIFRKDPKPYKVYTRSYSKNGECVKRIHSFSNRRQQEAFMARTTRAITFYN